MPKPGRPRIITGRDEQNVVRHILNGECSTAVDIQKRLKTDGKFDISVSTVKRVLRKNGFSGRIK